MSDRNKKNLLMIICFLSVEWILYWFRKVKRNSQLWVSLEKSIVIKVLVVQTFPLLLSFNSKFFHSSLQMNLRRRVWKLSRNWWKKFLAVPRRKVLKASRQKRSNLNANEVEQSMYDDAQFWEINYKTEAADVT